MVGEDYHQEVTSRLMDLKWSTKVIGQVHYGSREYPIFQTIVGEEDKPAIFLSGGIHGDEKAGMCTIFEFLENHIEQYLSKFRFFVYPCINPSGFENKTSTNANNVNINRDFVGPAESQEAQIIMWSLIQGPRYVFAMDLHEDGPIDPRDKGKIGKDIEDQPAPTEFYMWEICPDHSLRIGDKMVQAVENAGIPACKWPIIYKDTNSGGVIWYPEGCKNKTYAQGTTFEQYLARHYTPQAFVVESYSKWDLEKRVKAQLTALKTALEEHARKL